MKTQTATEESVMTLGEAMAVIERLRTQLADTKYKLQVEDTCAQVFANASKQIADDYDALKAQLEAAQVRAQDELTRRIAAERERDEKQRIIYEHEAAAVRMIEERDAERERRIAAEQTIADLRDLAYNRAPKLAAEECHRQTEELRARLEAAQVCAQDELTRRIAAEREAERYRLALEAVEWVDHSPFDSTCPWCERPSLDGHKPDCQRQAALSGREAGETGEK